MVVSMYRDMGIVVMKILQGSAVTQIMLGGLYILRSSFMLFVIFYLML